MTLLLALSISPLVHADQALVNPWADTQAELDADLARQDPVPQVEGLILDPIAMQEAGLQVLDGERLGQTRERFGRADQLLGRGPVTCSATDRGIFARDVDTDDDGFGETNLFVGVRYHRVDYRDGTTETLVQVRVQDGGAGGHTLLEIQADHVPVAWIEAPITPGGDVARMATFLAPGHDPYITIESVHVIEDTSLDLAEAQVVDVVEGRTRAWTNCD